MKVLVLLILCSQIPAQMTLLSQEGQVYVRIQGSNAFRQVQPGEVLPAQAVVMTRDESSAVLVARSGTVRRLRPNSRLTVPVEPSDQDSPLYTSALAKSQSRERSRLSMTQVGATRAQDNAAPLADTPMSAAQRQKLQEAEAGLEALDLDPISLALVRGALREEYAQWASAEKIYKAALATQPDHALLRDSLADLYFKQGKLRLAQEFRRP